MVYSCEYSADPDCGVVGTYCQCANGEQKYPWRTNTHPRNITEISIGHFYVLNRDTGNCNPPWAYIGNTEKALPGFGCYIVN